MSSRTRTERTAIPTEYSAKNTIANESISKMELHPLQPNANSETGGSLINFAVTTLPDPDRPPKKEKRRVETVPIGTLRDRRARMVLTPSQKTYMQAMLKKTVFPTAKEREAIAAHLGVQTRNIQVWFQNQRQKLKNMHGTTNAPTYRPPTPAMSPELRRFNVLADAAVSLLNKQMFT